MAPLPVNRWGIEVQEPEILMKTFPSFNLKIVYAFPGRPYLLSPSHTDYLPTTTFFFGTVSKTIHRTFPIAKPL